MMLEIIVSSTSEHGQQRHLGLWSFGWESLVYSIYFTFILSILHNLSSVDSEFGVSRMANVPGE